MFGSIKTHQYGQFYDGVRSKTAHIYAFNKFIGPIKKGMKCCHKCDNCRCVNPFHLFIATQRDNLRDASKKGRMKSFVKLGMDAPILRAIKLHKSSGKLTNVDVLQIRKWHDGGRTQAWLSTHYGVDSATVHAIVHRKSWKHI
jgi:hypothetical protein